MRNSEAERKRESVERSLTEAVWHFEARHGESPKVIFVTDEVWQFLTCHERYLFGSDWVSTWQGIHLMRVCGSGVGIWLSGDPVPIREVNPWRMGRKSCCRRD